MRIKKHRLLERFNDSKINWYKRFENKLLDQGFEAEFNPVDDSTVTIEIIGIPKEKHGQGYGSKIMNKLTSYADKNDIVLQLRPSASSTHSRSKLINFYQKFGFIENKGKDENEKYQYMYRLPQMSKVKRQEPVLVTESTLKIKKGKFITEYKTVDDGILIGKTFLPKSKYIHLNEKLSPEDEKRVKDIIRAQLKYFFWQLYTKQSFMLGNI